MVPMNVVRNPRSHPSDGYTLIELVIGVAVASIIASTTIVLSIPAWQRERLNAVAITFSGWLAEIAAQAERSGIPCVVTVGDGDPAPAFPLTLNPGDQLAEVDPPTCSKEPSFVIPTSTSRGEFVVGASAASWTFQPRGTVSNDTDLQVRIGIPGLATLRCVTVSAFFGQLRLARNDDTGNTGTDCDNFEAI